MAADEAVQSLRSNFPQPRAPSCSSRDDRKMHVARDCGEPSEWRSFSQLCPVSRFLERRPNMRFNGLI